MEQFGAVGTAAVLAGLVLLLWMVWIWMKGQRRRRRTPRDAYTLGLSALIGGDRGEALRHLRDAVQVDSENIDAYLRLGDLLRESGNVTKALAVHRDLTVRPRIPESDRVLILESLTRDYLAAGRYEEAGQSAERIRHIDRKNRFAFRALQQVAEALEDWPRAVRVVEERVKMEGDRDPGLLARYQGFAGSQQLIAGNAKEARKHFEDALSLDPNCLLARLYLGDMEQGEGNTQKAIEHWRELALEAPELGSLVFDRLERAFFELGQFGDVIEFYRELLHRSPREESAPALLALAEIHRRKGDIDEAESFVQEAMEVSPEHPRAHRNLVKLAVDRGDTQAALAHLDRLLTVLEEDSWSGACRHCSVSLHEPLWRCPQCKSLNPLGL
jgi:lipopolysaccharide biosynthesis regulator YciM